MNERKRPDKPELKTSNLDRCDAYEHAKKLISE